MISKIWNVFTFPRRVCYSLESIPLFVRAGLYYTLILPVLLLAVVFVIYFVASFGDSPFVYFGAG